MGYSRRGRDSADNMSEGAVVTGSRTQLRRQRFRVGPVSVITLMLISALIGLAAVPDYMPNVVGLSAEAALASTTNLSSNIAFATDNGEQPDANELADWVVVAQQPNPDEVVTSNTQISFDIRLTEQAQQSRAEAARLAAQAAEAERLEQERLAAEQAERDRVAAAEAEAAEQERLAAAAERAEQQRLAAEQAERDRATAAVAEAAAQAERDRLAAASPPAVAPAEPAPGPDIPARFRNCTHVWEVLGRPIRAGERGFHSRLDGDGDGVGCERDPR